MRARPEHDAHVIAWHLLCAGAKDAVKRSTVLPSEEYLTDAEWFWLARRVLAKSEAGLVQHMLTKAGRWNAYGCSRLCAELWSLARVAIAQHRQQSFLF